MQAFLKNKNHSHHKAFEVLKLASYSQVFSHIFFPILHAHTTTMGFRFPGIRKASFGTNQSSPKVVDVPKGYLAVYVGKEMKRFVIPVSYLNQPSFQHLLNQAEEEFGYDHPMGALTIPCKEDEFLTVTSHFE